MANNNIEIEIKLPLKNPEPVMQFLEKNAESQLKDLFQRDTYYTPAHKNFLDYKYPYEWLRLRETDKSNSINYKHFYPENTARNDYSDEFESNVENIASLKKIFKNLDIKEVAVVEKSRSTWMYKEVEIALDEVKGLGTFIELEATTSFEDPKKGKEFLYKILSELNADVGDEDYKGYPYRILQRKGLIEND